MRTTILVALLTASTSFAQSPSPSASPAATASPTAPKAKPAATTVPVPPAVVLDGAPTPQIAVRETLLPYMNVRSVGVQDFTADGKSLYITTRFGNTSQLHRVDMAMGARHQLTFFDEPVRRVRASHAKSGGAPFVVFSRDQGGGEDFQIHRFDLDTRRVTLLTDGASRNSSFELSPDAGLMAFTSNARNGKDMDVWVMDPRDPASRRLLCEVKGDFAVLSWSRDGRRILLEENISINESYIHETTPATGRMTLLTPRQEGAKSSYMGGQFTEDGHGIYTTTDRHGEFRELVRIELASGAHIRLTASIPWNIDEFEVAPSGGRLAYTVNDGGVSKLHLIDTHSGKQLPVPSLPVGVIGGLRFDPSGARLAFGMSTGRHPSDAFVLDVKSRKLARWTQSEVGGLDTSRWVEPQLVEFPTFDKAGDKPRMIPAFYFRPADKKPGEKHPVVIQIHGGPESQWRPSFNATAASWVQELGLAVIAPNVRGSDGYGKSYLLLDNGKLREDSVKDIGALLDWIKTRPELDASRVAVQGGSYGGYMVLASMFRFPDRLRAGVDAVGISRFVSFLENTKDYRRDLRRAEYGDERDPEMKKHLDDIAPLNHAGEIRAPLLCLQGANDPRVPASEAEQIVKALRANKIEAWYVLAKNEGHGFAKKDNQELVAAITYEFFEKFLVGK
jgi:dipeptidyl aminopeptidase/acylaminoacyl peptidase